MLVFVCVDGYSIDINDCVKRSFIVSGYYSPSQWQTFFYRGNYAKETRLNGMWIRWASGKKVFNGMIAAPKTYSFGTKIFFEKYGIWEISDRWWAIVTAWNRWYKNDRIDIWMWKWTQWLMKALSFGKQKVVWYVCNKKNNIEVWFDMNKFAISPKFFEETFWWVWQTTWRKDKWVVILQGYLSQLWYFNESPTWYFGPITENSVCKFQIKYKLSYAGKYDCWYLWPKTRRKLKSILTQKWLYKNKKIVSIKRKTTTIIHQKKEIKKVTYYRWFTKWEIDSNIKILQKHLAKLWYYKWDITGKYDWKTINAVFDFQVKTKIIKQTNISVGWYLWPKTRSKLNILAVNL